jgi:amino acid transporter
MSPSGVSTHAIIAGLVVAIFAYWGWDTCVSVNEEAEDSSRTPGIAAVLSTFILLGIYLLTSYGVVSLLGPNFVADNSGDAMYAAGKVALPTILVKLLVIAVLTSAAASCQTTILPATRTMLSMGAHGAAPKKLAQINHKQLTPDFSTWLFGGISIGWYLLLVLISHNTSTDAYSASIAAVGMAIAVYYGVSGLSCVWFFRRYLFKTLKNFVLIGLLPLFGGVVLIFVFAKTVWDGRNAAYGYGVLFGVGTVLLIGTLLLVVGVPLMIWCSVKYPTFFQFKADPIDTVPDPYGDNTLAAPLGTYTKENRRGR